MKTLHNLFKAMTMASYAGLASFARGNHARAADITFLCAGALQSAMQELLPEFQKASGHNVAVLYTNIGTITERVARGDDADLAIVSPRQWESLQKDGKLSAVPAIVIGKVCLGVFVKKGATRPDIASVDAFKRALLNVRSIAVSDANQGSPVGAYMIPLFDRLGIGGDIKSKLRLTPAGAGKTIEAVVKGDAEIGFNQMT